MQQRNYYQHGNPTVFTIMSAFVSGFSLSLSLIMAIGPQNAHVLRMGLKRSHLIKTVLACALTDVVLIAIGVMGFASISALHPFVHQGMMLGATVFLIYYGAAAAWRAYQGVEGGINTGAVDGLVSMTNKQALLTALAFSWLNPHAWLDTAVLIGSASLVHGAPNNYVFGAGAAVASIVWFTVLAWVAARLAHRLSSPKVWRGIDAVVAITMWGTAAWLIIGLVTSR